MKKQRFVILLVVLLTLSIACNGKTRPTPTPFSQSDAAEPTTSSTAPQAISITDLAADPEAYADTTVEITGQYRRRPLLVCETDPHPAPATWQLVAPDGSLVAVGGFDSQVRSLLPDNLTMTVVGVWQQFDGPVGCGKNATNTQIWYLKARDILSPSPIARVTLTPTGSGSQIAEGGDDTAVSTPGANDETVPTPSGGEDGGQPAGTPTLAGTGAPTPPGNGTPGSAPPPTSSGDDAATSTPTPTGSDDRATATPTGSGGSPSVTPTSGSGGAASATPTSGSGGSGNPTPTSVVFATATSNPNEFDTVEFPELFGIEPVLETLEAQQAHVYPIILEYSGAVTVTAVGEPTMDIVLEVLDPTNSIVAQASKEGVGEREAIIDAQLNTALDYRIRIYNLNDAAGDYCLIFSEGEGFADSIKGRIDYGQTVINEVEEFALNYWCFVGSGGDTVSASVTPTGSSGTFLVGLYGPNNNELGSAFDASTISNVELEDDGMHLIVFYNDEFDVAGYSLTLTKN
ncbi:MAG: hypothetical protein H6656_05605 [Ardenticatenaceae bacterium]|nr:hypothetical protein [Ardenticatenaceae bacterium]